MTRERRGGSFQKLKIAYHRFHFRHAARSLREFRRWDTEDHAKGHPPDSARSNELEQQIGQIRKHHLGRLRALLRR
jgi:hypothetical protein